VLLPTVVGFAAYGSAWLTGLAEGPVAGSILPDLEGMLPGSVLSDFELSPWTTLLARWALLVPIGTFFALVLAVGEELGWRGTMLNRLVDAKVPRPVLVSGVIWALWHVPLIIAGLYAVGYSLLLSFMLFLLNLTAFSVVIARVQWQTGSVWHACFIHASWNITILAVFDPSTKLTDEAEIWVGESGVLMTVCLLAMVAVLRLALGSWQIRRHPEDPPEQLAIRP